MSEPSRCELCGNLSTYPPDSVPDGERLREALVVAVRALEQERAWKVEDPRMLREQIRVADAAFNHLQERHQAALAEIELLKDANLRANAAIGDIANECRTLRTRCEAAEGMLKQLTWLTLKS
jgi:hypothetical protein